MFQKTTLTQVISNTFFTLGTDTTPYSIVNVELPEKDIYDIYYKTARRDEMKMINVQGEQIGRVISQFYRFMEGADVSGMKKINTNTGYFQSFFRLYLLKASRKTELFFPMEVTEPGIPNEVISEAEAALMDLMKGLSEDATMETMLKVADPADVEWMSTKLTGPSGLLDFVNIVKWYKGLQDVLIKDVVFDELPPGGTGAEDSRFQEIEVKAMNEIENELIKNGYFIKTAGFELNDFFEMANKYLFDGTYTLRPLKG